jgi:peroxiredoxin Q/BCP
MKAVLLLTVLTLTGLGMAAMPAAAGDLKVGDQAPNFKLQATDGKTYELNDFKGKESVVLAWFPKAFTQGCTIECKSLAEHGDMIKMYNAQYFMVSVDPIEGEKGNKAFADSLHADFPLLSDPTKETANAYGVLNTERGFANRWTFYIGKDGKITAIDKDVNKRLATSAEDMAATLKQLGTEMKKK